MLHQNWGEESPTSPTSPDIAVIGKALFLRSKAISGLPCFAHGVEQAFMPAAKPRKLPASAAEVTLFLRFNQRSNCFRLSDDGDVAR